MNNELKKTVIVTPRRPISGFNPPIRSRVKTKMTAGEIRKCILEKAKVVEILKDGTELVLDFTNYNKDNEKSAQEAELEKARETARKAEEEAAKKKAEEDKKKAEEAKRQIEEEKKKLEEAKKQQNNNKAPEVKDTKDIEKK